MWEDQRARATGARREAAAAAVAMQAIRIFISSPGDVAQERERARQVVQGLRRRYARHFDLVPVSWEDMPLSVDASFQQGIDAILSRDRGVDIAVFILWSRLGTPLGPLLRRDDGREYRSGTERELSLMLEAREAQQGVRPQILAYARCDEAAFEESLRGRSTVEKEEMLRQKRLVETFLQEEFHDTDTGTNLRAYHTFTRPPSFAQRLRVHLQEILDGLCGDRPVRPAWDVDVNGPPFRGLEPFGYEHADIFFGREDDVAEARARLTEAARRGTAFLLIGGASGTGKSSLAAAGLLPEIVTQETDDTVSRWLHAVCTPASLHGDPATGLARVLLRTIPGLAARGSEADLAAGLGRDPELTIRLAVVPALKSLGGGVDATARLLILVDQLEEAFTDPALDDAGRERLARILQSLAASGSVWVVATLRADWYPRLLECTAFVVLKTAGAQLDLVPPQVDAVRRVIESPAVVSGLSYEKAGTTTLADRILRDVAEQAELLPLLEDLLRELFDRRTPQGLLSFSAYESLGGIEGSLEQRAEAGFAALPAAARQALPEVLRGLVAAGEGPGSPAVRRRARLASFPEGSPARAVVDRLIADRLAVATAGEDGSPEVSIAHEAILRVWGRAAGWIAENTEFLRVRDRLAARMREGAPLAAGDPLAATARGLLATRRESLEPELAAYAEAQLAAIDADRLRRDRLRRRAVAGLAALAVAATVTATAAAWQWREAARARRAAEAASAKAERSRETAERSRSAAEKLVEFMTFDLRDKLEPLGRLDLLGDVLGKLQAYHDERMRLEETGEERTTADDLRTRNVLHRNLGDLARATGDVNMARHYYESALAIAAPLAIADARAAELARDVAVSHGKLGTLALDMGNVTVAREHYDNCLRIVERLIDKDPGDDTLQRDLAGSHDRLGDVAMAAGDIVAAADHYRKSQSISEDVASRNPLDPENRRGLAVGHERLGELASAAGDTASARRHYEHAITLRESLVADDERNPGLQRTLAASHSRLGDIMQHTGDVGAARAHQETALAIMEKVAAADGRNTGWQRDLAISCIKVGDLSMEADDFAAAGRQYSLSLAVMGSLAKQDPRNAGWQRDLSVIHGALGDLARRTGDNSGSREHLEESFKIRKSLVTQDPSNAQCRWDLAAALSRLGNVAMADNDLEAARQHYHDAFVIHRVLAEEDERNMDWQWGLAASNTKLGEVAHAAGDLDGARERFEDAVAILRRLTSLDPGNVARRRDVVATYHNLGTVARSGNAWADARDWFQKEIEAADELFGDSRDGEAATTRAAALEQLAACHRKLGENAAAEACERRIAELSAKP